MIVRVLRVYQQCKYKIKNIKTDCIFVFLVLTNSLCLKQGLIKTVALC